MLNMRGRYIGLTKSGCKGLAYFEESSMKQIRSTILSSEVLWAETDIPIDEKSWTPLPAIHLHTRADGVGTITSRGDEIISKNLVFHLCSRMPPLFWLTELTTWHCMEHQWWHPGAVLLHGVLPYRERETDRQTGRQTHTRIVRGHCKSFLPIHNYVPCVCVMTPSSCQSGWNALTSHSVGQPWQDLWW